uniref:Uncharacterized protein n=1 Tax=Junco hyemalis TaxID=40217 RepID=A0A8C5IH49_JUNHY
GCRECHDKHEPKVVSSPNSKKEDDTTGSKEGKTSLIGTSVSQSTEVENHKCDMKKSTAAPLSPSSAECSESPDCHSAAALQDSDISHLIDEVSLSTESELDSAVSTLIGQLDGTDDQTPLPLVSSPHGSQTPRVGNAVPQVFAADLSSPCRHNFTPTKSNKSSLFSTLDTAMFSSLEDPEYSTYTVLHEASPPSECKSHRALVCKKRLNNLESNLPSSSCSSSLSLLNANPKRNCATKSGPSWEAPEPASSFGSNSLIFEEALGCPVPGEHSASSSLLELDGDCQELLVTAREYRREDMSQLASPVSLRQRQEPGHGGDRTAGSSSSAGDRSSGSSSTGHGGDRTAGSSSTGHGGDRSSGSSSIGGDRSSGSSSTAAPCAAARHCSRTCGAAGSQPAVPACESTAGSWQQPSEKHRAAVCASQAGSAFPLRPGALPFPTHPAIQQSSPCKSKSLGDLTSEDISCNFESKYQYISRSFISSGLRDGKLAAMQGVRPHSTDALTEQLRRLLSPEQEDGREPPCPRQPDEDCPRALVRKLSSRSQSRVRNIASRARERQEAAGKPRPCGGSAVPGVVLRSKAPGPPLAANRHSTGSCIGRYLRGCPGERRGVPEGACSLRQHGFGELLPEQPEIYFLLRL